MDKISLKNKLSENHRSFVELIFSLTNEEFLSSKNDKWTAGQQLEHICLSVKPLNQALILPKFLIKLVWGQANRESRSYEDLVKKYVLKLENGGRASGRFIPEGVNIEKKQKLKTALESEVRSLCAKIDKFSEAELDQYILPHPLLGKLTLREMFYFTMHHVEHHQALTKENLKS